MSQPIKPQKTPLALADVLRRHMGEYRKAYPLRPDQQRIVSDLLKCRTPSLGGHLERCSQCGAERIRYHSCRNRSANLAFIRRLLNVPARVLKTTSSLHETMFKLTGIDITRCPCCNKGRMHLVAHIPRLSGKHVNRRAIMTH
jgi:hypothetical protein